MVQHRLESSSGARSKRPGAARGGPARARSRTPRAPAVALQRLLGVVLLLGAPGCGSPDAAPVQLTIASDATFAPFHYLVEGVPTGFDIELASAVARRAGFDPIVVVRPYDELFEGLREDTHDVIAATTGITPEREREYLFTRPYFETAQAVLVRVGPSEPTESDDLRGLRVGAAGSGTSVRALGQLTGVEPVLLGSGEAQEAVIDKGGVVPLLEDGTIDALIVDEFDAVSAARASDGRLAVLSEPAALESYAFVLRLGRPTLKERLDAALDELEATGALDSLRFEFGVARDSTWPVVIPR